VRRLDERGHQTSILSTDYSSDLARAAAAMFARWHQENFFKYMRDHYGLDKLVEHGFSPLPETTRLVNPAWRALDRQVRQATGLLTRQHARFAAQILQAREDEPDAVARHEGRQGEQLAALERLQAEQVACKAQRKATAKHIELKDLPEDQRVAQLRSGRKQFIDTIKLISYRAESALMHIAQESLARTDDARSFVRSLLQSSVNLRPDKARGVLRSELHGQANPLHDQLAARLCAELNTTETHYPGSSLRLEYATLRSPSFPAGQDV